MASRAFVIDGNFHFFFFAENRIFERNAHLALNVGAFAGARAPSGRAGALRSAEERGENIAKIKSFEAGAVPAEAGVRILMAELVVLGALLAVGEDLVRFLNFFEFGFRIFLGRNVGMVFLRQPAVSLLDFVFRRRF